MSRKWLEEQRERLEEQRERREEQGERLEELRERLEEQRERLEERRKRLEESRMRLRESRKRLADDLPPLAGLTGTRSLALWRAFILLVQWSLAAASQISFSLASMSGRKRSRSAGNQRFPLSR